MAVIFLLVALQSAVGTPRVALTGTFQNRRLRESSGVAASRTHRGVLWSNNDSADGPYVYATDLAGTDRGAVRIRGADAADWEDIALGPCPSLPGSCLYIADTGDNDERRKSVVIYAVPEPLPPAARGDTARSAPAAALRLRYPDGPHDVEAMYVSPRDTAVYLVSKGRRGPVHLYRLPRSAWRSERTATASLVQELATIVPAAAFGQLVTGAAIRPDGRLVAVRTYRTIHFFVPGAGGRLAPSDRPVCDIAGLEPQGEGVAFLDDATLVLTSEAGTRARGQIHSARCP